MIDMTLNNPRHSPLAIIHLKIISSYSNPKSRAKIGHKNLIIQPDINVPMSSSHVIIIIWII